MCIGNMKLFGGTVQGIDARITNNISVKPINNPKQGIMVSYPFKKIGARAQK